MHALTIRTAVLIEKISNKISGRNKKTDDDNILRTGDTADILLKFKFGKKFIKPETKYYFMRR